MSGRLRVFHGCVRKRSLTRSRRRLRPAAAVQRNSRHGRPLTLCVRMRVLTTGKRGDPLTRALLVHIWTSAGSCRAVDRNQTYRCRWAGSSTSFKAAETFTTSKFYREPRGGETAPLDVIRRLWDVSTPLKEVCRRGTQSCAPRCMTGARQRVPIRRFSACA